MGVPDSRAEMKACTACAQGLVAAVVVLIASSPPHPVTTPPMAMITAMAIVPSARMQVRVVARRWRSPPTQGVARS